MWICSTLEFRLLLAPLRLVTGCLTWVQLPTGCFDQGCGYLVLWVFEKMTICPLSLGKEDFCLPLFFGMGYLRIMRYTQGWIPYSLDCSPNSILCLSFLFLSLLLLPNIPKQHAHTLECVNPWNPSRLDHVPPPTHLGLETHKEGMNEGGL